MNGQYQFTLKGPIENCETAMTPEEVVPERTGLEEPSPKAGSKPSRTIPFSGFLTNKLLANLPGEDFACLLPHLEYVSLLAGHDLYEFGEPIDYCYFPETAIVSHIYFMQDGSSTAAGLVGKEGMVGLSAILDDRPPTYWAQVTIGGTALRIRQSVIKDQFARSKATQHVILNYTSGRLAQLSQKAVCNGRHKLDERFCTWLLMIHDRTSENELPLTHEEIAHCLGARRAGITGACNVLRENGIITYRRGFISIADRSMLEALACECYSVLKACFG
jgi:CRP-like cAMP-binding protein